MQLCRDIADFVRFPFYRDAVIVEIAERIPVGYSYYRRVADEAQAILGIEVSPKIAYNVLNCPKSARFGNTF